MPIYEDGERERYGERDMEREIWRERYGLAYAGFTT